MWAQLIKLQVRPDTEMQVRGIVEQLRATEQPESGLLRSLAMRDQKDPTAMYFLAVFESEEKARVREQDPRRKEGLQQVNAMMAEVLVGPPEFIDLEVMDEITMSSRQS